MTNTDRLKGLISNSGLKYLAIAEKMGLTYYGLQKKINNVTEFKASEIAMLCDILKISNSEEKESIFFAQKVDL